MLILYNRVCDVWIRSGKVLGPGCVTMVSGLDLNAISKVNRAET